VIVAQVYSRHGLSEKVTLQSAGFRQVPFLISDHFRRLATFLASRRCLSFVQVCPRSVVQVVRRRGPGGTLPLVPPRFRPPALTATAAGEQQLPLRSPNLVVNLVSTITTTPSSLSHTTIQRRNSSCVTSTRRLFHRHCPLFTPFFLDYYRLHSVRGGSFGISKRELKSALSNQAWRYP
jgi:hypothetical protein